MRVSRCNSTLKEINAARVYEDSPPGCPQPIYPALGWARGMAEEKPVVLYPAYFDLKRSREEGRRVPKALAVDGPTTEEIEKAAKALGLDPTVEDDKAYPPAHWRKEGRVLVRADYFKTSIVRKVAERIKAARQA